MGIRRKLFTMMPRDPGGALLATIFLLGLLFYPFPATGQDKTAVTDGPVNLDESLYDSENGEEINEICAACHGVYGEGGGDGTYPRLAGLPAAYLANQLRAFKSRERINIAMFPFATDRRLPEDDVRDISIYLSRIELYKNMPDVGDEVTAYEKLLIAKRVFNVARVEGDMDAGRELYGASCKKCHGRDGAGRGKIPPLAGQFTEYLQNQIDMMLRGERPHRKMEKYIEPLTEENRRNIFAYLSSVDD